MSALQMDDAKNYLYPPLDARKKFMCENYCKTFKNFKDGVGETKTITIDTAVQMAIQDSTSSYCQHFCTKCDRSHEWIIAGGYAAYLSGYTNVYSDIDIFISCNGNFSQMLPTTTQNNVLHYHNRTHIIDMICNNGIKVQFIKVDFDLNLPSSSIQYLDSMMNYVISNFDMPVCRIAMSVKIEDVNNIDVTSYVINQRDIEEVKVIPRQCRKDKYARRLVSGINFKVPSLKSQCVRAFFK